MLDDDFLYLYYSGWTPAFHKYSAMTTLNVEIFKWAISRKIFTVHLSTGRDPSKTRWAPIETIYLEAACASEGPRGYVSDVALRTVRSIRSRLGNVPGQPGRCNVWAEEQSS